MTASRSRLGLRGPLLAALALAIGVITAVSPSSPGPGGAAPSRDGAAPPPVPVPVAAKQQVPVRLTDPPRGAAGRGDLVALRQLVVATGPDDFGLATWKAVLDGIGSPYDVLLAGTEPLVPQRLVHPDGTGRYNAVLLTNNALLRQQADGAYASALDDAQWAVLWDYEREYRVRQVSLNTYPGTTPEDHCLRIRGEGPVGRDPVPLTLTPAGQDLFDYLAPQARIPLSDSHLYRARLAEGCAGQALLSAGDDVVAVVAKAPDGRERLALTFATGPDSMSALLLGYGMVRWATHGVLLGEHRHWFSVDVDDWFNATLRLRADGGKDLFRLSGAEAASVAAQQRALRERSPVASAFTLNLPYNGSRLNTSAPATCEEKDTPDPLSSCSKRLVDQFRWINHTSTHPQMNDTSYDVSRTEISTNLEIAAAAGLPVPPTVLKTPEYSGLGVYNPDPQSLDPPTDFGLAASNKAMLDAAHDLGVRYVQGNMSFDSHRPACFNCGIDHPLRPELFVVPDWPTNVAFEATTPEEQTVLYNAEYGREGRAPDHADQDLTYEQFVDAEAEVALRHLVSGSAYAHTLHQGNLHEHAPGRSLAFDWIGATVDKYAAYYRVPLKNPDWLALAGYVQGRNAHFAELSTRRDAVWNRATGAIDYVPGADGALFLTGVQQRPATDEDQRSADEGETYGSDPVARVGLTGGERVTLMASPRP
ncbi:Agd3-related carbohydrate-binding protein [Saccharothrix coeruleofusca]|uniref:Uncharacterized protein n=1 Tax=Saccharothrix coeruleofusca TaxID=33919 RepID=A0A918AS60_9PSEU|nr:hypothetical protein [Saccharothrix coeruleofusca]MBP2336726.1 hypothetical protein [Saccharothrix coeruleofusca]GGP78476.1 hypothetical protein GCM10010185_60310 [Saccharothrix coeruleofusca]